MQRNRWWCRNNITTDSLVLREQRCNLLGTWEVRGYAQSDKGTAGSGGQDCWATAWGSSRARWGIKLLGGVEGRGEAAGDKNLLGLAARVGGLAR